MTVSLQKEKSVVKTKIKPALKIPNAETIRVIREVQERKNLISYDSIDDFFKEFHTNESN